MPPHRDAIDGPVARAALEALDAKDVEIALLSFQVWSNHVHRALGAQALRGAPAREG